MSQAITENRITTKNRTTKVYRPFFFGSYVWVQPTLDLKIQFNTGKRTKEMRIQFFFFIKKIYKIITQYMVKSMAIPDLGQTKRWFTVSDRPKKK